MTDKEKIKKIAELIINNYPDFDQWDILDNIMGSTSHKDLCDFIKKYSETFSVFGITAITNGSLYNNSISYNGKLL